MIVIYNTEKIKLIIFGGNIMQENEFLKSLSFWGNLNDSERKFLTDSCTEKKYKKGMIINRSTEECLGTLIIKSGQIRVFMVSEEGREITLFRLNASDVCVFSASCLLEAITFEVIIEVAKDVEALLISSSALNYLMKKNPYVELFLAKTANKRFSDVMWIMQQILFMSSDKRVAVFLYDEFKKTNKIILSYTHEEIARLIGTAREVVTRVLKYFASENVIKLSRGKIEITDIEKLKNFCD